jgi:hypothetical protein
VENNNAANFFAAFNFYLLNSPTGTNFIETELTQCRTFLGVRYSPSKTWPRCAPQLLQTISTRRPSASGTRFTAPGISSSKLGQPQCDSNFDADVYSGVSQRLHTYKPSALLFNSVPVNGRSVPLCSIMYSSSGVNLLYSMLLLVII